MSKTLINLALQGGGPHGAFTWGVFDRILEDGQTKVSAISGTSAWAMNAATFAEGLTQGGRETARERLGAFWIGISEMAGIVARDCAVRWT
ncbi:MAG: patatin-like phospholipase family protein [Rhodovibrio sp.]|nr:patatin-like phospholipase family protein [Rhodovibrio sp.]